MHSSKLDFYHLQIQLYSHARKDPKLVDLLNQLFDWIKRQEDA